MSETADIVVLRIPRGAKALSVMRVVISGFASRHDMPLDKLDDLQLAIETLLAEEPSVGNELVLEVSARGAEFRMRLDGLLNPGVRSALLASDPFKPCPGCVLDVRLILDSLLDCYALEDAPEGAFGVVMDKRASS